MAFHGDGLKLCCSHTVWYLTDECPILFSWLERDNRDLRGSQAYLLEKKHPKRFEKASAGAHDPGSTQLTRDGQGVDRVWNAVEVSEFRMDVEKKILFHWVGAPSKSSATYLMVCCGLFLWPPQGPHKPRWQIGGWRRGHLSPHDPQSPCPSYLSKWRAGTAPY